MKKIVFGTRKLLRKRNGKKKIVDVEDAFYYIPLLETLQTQLKSPVLLDFILAGPVVSEDDYSLKDFCDGTQMKSHPLFGVDMKALKIILYYDDVNVCNPLSNKMHKISAFYYQVANLPTKYRSKLKSINVLALCTSANMKRYGIDRIFEPLVEELKKLGDDSGYPFQIYQGTVHLRGGLLAVVADTPASQEAGGFKSGVGGAFRKCRHCMATYNSMQEHFSEEKFTLRCSEDHEKYLGKIENAPTQFLRTYYSKKTGITRRSKLLEAPHFDVCQQLPQDLMHVFLEGVLGYEIKYMLRYYIQDQKLLSVSTLNSRIQNFLLGYAHKKSKPAPIFERDLERNSSSNLGQSASEMWLLSRILPFILTDYVDTSSEHWTCFTTLLEIIAICFSQTINYTEIIYLKQLISDHLSLFKTLYDGPIIPKQHYMVHIPSLTLKFGPLIRSWTMRFESKHTYFKTIAKNTKNFKNLPYSLTSRLLAKDYAENIQLDKDVPMSLLFKNSIGFGKAKQIVDSNEKRNALLSIKRFYDIDPPVTENLYLCDSVSVEGKSYVTGENNMVLCGKTPSGVPEFGCIKKIWYFEIHGLFLALEVMETIAFSEVFQAFQVDKCNAAQGYQITMPEDLISLDVVHAYTGNGKSYIPLRESFFI